MPKPLTRHSLGTLRLANRTKERSPNLIGQITIQRSDFMAIQSHFQDTGREEVMCNIAGWFYDDSQGKSITVQLSPPYGRRAVVATTLESFFEESDEVGEN